MDQMHSTYFDHPTTADLLEWIQSLVLHVDFLQQENSKMNRSSRRKCKIQQPMPEIELKATSKSATLHQVKKENG